MIDKLDKAQMIEEEGVLRRDAKMCMREKTLIKKDRLCNF